MSLLERFKQWISQLGLGGASYLHSSSITRQTRAEQKRRAEIFNSTRPHYGDDLIAALEFENFITNKYQKGGNNADKS